MGSFEIPFVVLLFFLQTKELTANPYGYYYPSYSRTRRDPATGEWEQNNGPVPYGYQQQGNLYNIQPAGVYNRQPQLQQDYQTNYRSGRDAVVPPLVPVAGNGNTDSDLFYQQSNNYGNSATQQGDTRGSLYDNFAQNQNGLNRPILQPLPENANPYGNQMQPIRLDDYKPMSLDFGQMSKQQPNIDNSKRTEVNNIPGKNAQSSDGNYPGMGGDIDGLGMIPPKPGMPPHCLGVTCDSLDNCINVNTTESACCPECTQYGCQCGEGYQYFDCLNRGYEDGLVPEGEVYYVDDGSTQCFCPLGGGEIICRFRDPDAPTVCAQIPENCIKTFKLLDSGCEECLTVGCIDKESGQEHEAGKSFDKPPCSMCYCPPTGGELICGKYPTCADEDVQGFGSSIREIDSRGKLDGYTNLGYPQYGGGGYAGNGYADYNGYIQQPTQTEDSSSDKNAHGDPQSQDNDGDTNANANIQQHAYPQQQNPYMGYQDPYSAYGNTGGYYPAYGGGYDQRYGGYNPYVPVANSKEETGENKEGSEHDDDTAAEGNDDSLNPESPKLPGTDQQNHFQQLYPYYQQQGGYGGYNPYGNAYGYPPYSGQSKTQDVNSEQPGSEVGEHGQTALNNQQAGSYYPYNPYPTYNQQASLQDLPVGSNSPKAQDADEPSSGNDNNLAAGSLQSAKRINSISNPYLDPNYVPTLSSYLPGENQYPHQNPYAFNSRLYNNYGLQPIGGLNDNVEIQSNNKPSNGSENTGVVTGQNAGSNPDNPAGMGNPLDPYGTYRQQQMGAYYPYNGPYYNDPFYNQMQQYSQTGQRTNQISPLPTSMEGMNDNADNIITTQPPAEIFNPARKPVIPDLVGIPRGENLNTPASEDQRINQHDNNMVKQAQLHEVETPVQKQRPEEQNSKRFIQKLQSSTKTTQVTTTTPTPATTVPTTTPKVTQTTTTTRRTRIPIKVASPTQPTTTNHSARTTAESTKQLTTRHIQHKNTSIRFAQKITRTHEDSIVFKPSPFSNEATYENVLTTCCLEGRQWGATHDSCSNIATKTSAYNQICGVAQEKCCLEALNQRFCNLGITEARSMAACDQPNADTCSATQFKTCCDCCALGLKAKSWRYDCDGSMFGGACDIAYRKCCMEGHMESGVDRSDESNAGGDIASMNSVNRLEGTLPVERGPHCASDNICEQICTDTHKGMVCSCRRGYRLAQDSRGCVDVNECVLGTYNCLQGQFCVNKIGSYHCQRRLSCGTGYELTDKNECRDIDECELNLHDCFANFVCVNTRGSYKCEAKLCDTGYLTDATGNCIDFNECESGDYVCPDRAVCVNTNGAYECVCGTGNELNSDGTACLDINECLSDPCSVGSRCSNTDGSYMCIEPPKLRCNPGYKPNLLRTRCVDIDECMEGTHECNEGATCINNNGGYTCEDPLECEQGYKPSSDERRCIDIDECRDPHKNLCSSGGTCVNYPGTFECACNPGYKNVTAPQGIKTCSDIDECETPTGSSCAYRCRNSQGSYECYCPNGYKVTDFGRSCDDIDECVNRTTCSESEACFNTIGGHKCLQINCPVHYNKKLNNDRTKVTCIRSCHPYTQWCRTLPKTYSYLHMNIPVTSVSQWNKKLVLNIRQGSNTVQYSITDGNSKGIFQIVTSAKENVAKVFVVKTLTPGEVYVITITAREGSEQKAAVVYFYAYMPLEN